MRVGAALAPVEDDAVQWSPPVPGVVAAPGANMANITAGGRFVQSSSHNLPWVVAASASRARFSVVIETSSNALHLKTLES